MKVRQISQQQRRQVKFNWPFARAVECCRQQALSRPDYDPATMAVYGSLMARGLVEMLQAVERESGEKGQEVATRAHKGEERVYRGHPQTPARGGQTPSELPQGRIFG